MKLFWTQRIRLKSLGLWKSTRIMDHSCYIYLLDTNATKHGTRLSPIPQNHPAF